FLSERYGPEGLVISAAGAVTHGEIERHANALFGGLSPRSPRPEPSSQTARYCGGARHSDRSFEQAHVIVGFEGPSFRSEDAYTAQVFSGLLGGG
ncbi:insulinase family protein, partial [Escherichia coli]